MMSVDELKGAVSVLTDQRIGHRILEMRAPPPGDAALARLQRRYRLALLSNGDPDMLENAKPHIGFAFDALISIADFGYFKPHYLTYRRAAERLGVAPGAVLHVANHAFDCVGAKAAGMRAAFVDRRSRPFGETPHRPDLVVANLKELADRLA